MRYGSHENRVNRDLNILEGPAYLRPEAQIRQTRRAIAGDTPGEGHAIGLRSIRGPVVLNASVFCVARERLVQRMFCSLKSDAFFLLDRIRRW